MRGLFTKIFLGFWIAQSLTFAISTWLIMQRSFVRPNEIMDVLKTALPTEGAAVVNTYETAGCSGLREYAASRNLTIYLSDTPNHFLCEPAGAPVAADALIAAEKQPGVVSTPAGDFYLWSTTDPFCYRPQLRFPAQPAANRKQTLAARSCAFCLSSAMGSDRSLRSGHFCSRSSTHASHRQTAGRRSQSGQR